MDERFRKYKTIETAFKARARGDRELICMFWGRWRELMRVWNYMITVRHDVRRRTALLDQVRENYLKDVWSVKLALSQARKNGHNSHAAFASTIEPTPTLDLRGWVAPPSSHKAKFDEIESLGYLKLAGVGEEAEKKRDGYEILEESTIPCYAPNECAFLSRHCDNCQGILAMVYARNERVTAALGLVTNWEKFQADTKDELLRIPDLEKQTRILREQLVNTGSLLSASELRVSELEDSLQALQKLYSEDTSAMQKKFETVDKIAGKVPDLEVQITVLTEIVHKLEAVQSEKLDEINKNHAAIAALEELVVSSKSELERQLAVREAALSRAKQGLLEANGRAEMSAEELRFQQSEAVPTLRTKVNELMREVQLGEKFTVTLQSELQAIKEKLETAELRGDRLAMELSTCRADLAEALTPPVVADAEVQATPKTVDAGMHFQWSEHKQPTGVFKMLPVSRAVEAFSDAPEEVTVRQTVVEMGCDAAIQFTPLTQDGSTHCVLKTEAELKLENELDEALDKMDGLEETLEKTNRSLKTTQIELKLANEEIEDIGNERDEALELVETIEKATTDRLNSQWNAKYLMQGIISRLSLNTQQALTQRLAGMLNTMKVKIKGQSNFLNKLSSGTTKLAAHSAFIPAAQPSGEDVTAELERGKMKMIQERVQEKQEMKAQFARDKAELEQKNARDRADAKAAIADTKAEVAAMSKLAGDQLKELEMAKSEIEKHQNEVAALAEKTQSQEDVLQHAKEEMTKQQERVAALASDTTVQAEELEKAKADLELQKSKVDSLSQQSGAQSEALRKAQNELEKLSGAQQAPIIQEKVVVKVVEVPSQVVSSSSSISSVSEADHHDASSHFHEEVLPKSALMAAFSPHGHHDEHSLEDDDESNLELMGGNGDPTTFHHDAEALENFSSVIDNRVEELLEKARDADKKVAHLRFILAVRTSEAKSRAMEIARKNMSLDDITIQMEAERSMKLKLQSQITSFDNRLVQLKEEVQKLTRERDEAIGVGEQRLVLIEEGKQREEKLHEELNALKNSYDALAAQRLEELDQLNKALEAASLKIAELGQERDLLLGDKALLTSAVNDAYRTHCSEVKRVFLDNLKQTRSVGTQLDCCVCAMRTPENVANAHIPAQGYGTTTNSVNSQQQKNDGGSSIGSSKRSGGGAKGNFRSSNPTKRPDKNKMSLLPPTTAATPSTKKVNIVVDRTGQRYPFSVGTASRGVSVSTGPSTRSMNSEALGLHLPRTTPIGAAISKGRLVPSSTDLRSTPHSIDSIQPPPLPWAPILPTDQARIEQESSTNQNLPFNDEELTREDDEEGTESHHSNYSESWSGSKQQIMDDVLSSHLENERFRASLPSSMQHHQSITSSSSAKDTLSPMSRKKNLSPIHRMGYNSFINRQESDVSDTDFNFYPSLSQFAPPAPPKQKVETFSQGI